MTEPDETITARAAIVRYRDSSPSQLPKSAPTTDYEWVIFKHNVRIIVSKPYGKEE